MTGTVIETDRSPYGHLGPLLARFALLAAGHPQHRPVREELIAGYMPVVVNIARRYRNRGEPTDDLEQVGAIGLMNALERFEPERGSDFLSYAIPTITGEIRRHFRDRTWSVRVPRKFKDLQVPTRHAVEVLAGVLGRAPRPSEIAEHMGIPVGDVISALDAQNAYTADSLDAPVGNDLTFGDLLGRVDTSLSTAEHRAELRQALDTLPDRERTIVVLRFFDDRTQTQIGAAMGISQMHVSRLLARALMTLRSRMDGT